MSDPFINACFEERNNLFVNVYNPKIKQLTYFSLDLFKQELLWNPVQIPLSHKKVNFPIRNFYDSTRHLYYIVCRHGQSIIVNPQYPKIAKQ